MRVPHQSAPVSSRDDGSFGLCPRRCRVELPSDPNLRRLKARPELKPSPHRPVICFVSSAARAKRQMTNFHGTPSFELSPEAAASAPHFQFAVPGGEGDGK